MRLLRVITATLVVVTALWAVLTIVSVSETDPEWMPPDYLRWIAHPSLATTLNYLNAAVVTAVAVAFFALLAAMRYRSAPGAVSIAAAFVPIYGTMNLAVYVSQISLVPSLARAAIANQTAEPVVAQMLQLSSEDTVVALLNVLAYAILAVPSAIFGLVVLRREGRPVFSGALLAASGVSSVVGFVGAMTGSGSLETGVLAGGGLFLVALVVLYLQLPVLDSLGFAGTTEEE